MPNKKIPTKLLISPKNFAPLKPNEDLNNTAKGKPNFREGFPIIFENKYTKNDPSIVPKKTTNAFKLYIR